MRVEEVEKLSKKELRARANACFAQAEVPGYERGPLLFEAQFYMRELEHRADSRVSIRDLILEIVVIALIGWEIHMGYRQSADQATEFGQQQKIFQNLETSSQATADTMTALKSTTENMNGALQKQLALFYDVSINVNYDQEKKRLILTNLGRTNVALWGTKFFDDAASIESQGRSLQANGGGYDINAARMYDYAIARMPKGQTGLAPFEIYLKNERSEEFVEHCYFGISWNGDVLKLAPQIASIVPERWSRPKVSVIAPSANP
jgi:hypothetical protein